MAMASGDLIEELCDEVMCPICLEYFKGPVILDCGHNFCQSCLMQHWGGFLMTGSCPQCRGTPQGKGFRPNWQLANIVKIVKKLQERKRVESGKRGVCLRHPEPLKLVRRDDQVLVCVECSRSMECEGHNVLPMEKAPQECKEKKLAQLTSLEKEREKLKEQKATEVQGSQKCPEGRTRFSPGLDSGTGNHHGEWGGPEWEEDHAAQVCHLFEQMEILQAQEGRVIKLPPLDPESFPTYKAGDDIHTFFAFFEMACIKQGVVGPQRMIFLCSQTSGMLAELLLHLPREKRYDYEYFKGLAKQILVPSAEDCRRKFRNTQVEPGEKFVAFAKRLTADLDAWIKAAEATTWEKLRELIVLERFHQVLPENISTYVSMHSSKTLREAGLLVDKMALCGEWDPTFCVFDQYPVGNRTEKVAKSQWWGRQVPPSPGAGAAGGRGWAGATSTAQPLCCFYCKGVAHLKRNCPKLAQKQPGGTASPRVRGIPKPASVAPSAPYYWGWSSNSDFEWE